MDQTNSCILLNELFEVSLTGFATGSENLSLIICCKKDTFEYQYAFVANNSSETRWLFPDPDKESIYIFPLYANHETRNSKIDKIDALRSSNLNPEIINQIVKKLFLPFTGEKENTNQENNSPVCYANSEEVSEEFKIDVLPQVFDAIDILDYIYAVLHSGKYKKKYKDQLKKDFPIIPFPKNQITFWKLATLGKKLRKLHLLDGPEVEKYFTKFPADGENLVNMVRFEENYEIIDGESILHISPLYPMGKVFINETQFFQMVPKLAWELSLGNHQPAQKWLEDKKGSVLKTEEIMKYQEIIVALFETDNIINEIDGISF